MGSNLALWRPEERLCTTEWAVTLITRVVWFGIWVWDWWAVSLIPKPFGLRSGYEAGELLASVVHWQSVFSLQKTNWLWSSQCGYQCTDYQSVSLCRMQWVKLDKEKVWEQEGLYKLHTYLMYYSVYLVRGHSRLDGTSWLVQNLSC